MWPWLTALFGISGVTDTALKIIEKVSGTDWSDKEKAQFVLDYQNATKHQSPARRVIAIAIAFVWAVLVMSWFVASAVGRFVYDAALNPGTVLAADISAFIDLNITSPFNIILAFYFTTQILSGLKK